MTQLQVEEISVVVSVVNHLLTRIFTSLRKKSDNVGVFYFWPIFFALLTWIVLKHIIITLLFRLEDR